MMGMGQSETLSSSKLDHIYYTLFFCRCTALLLLTLSPATNDMLSQNHYFPESNWHMLGFSFFFHFFYCSGDSILSTTGDALRNLAK
jgi:hypothetical protein